MASSWKQADFIDDFWVLEGSKARVDRATDYFRGLDAHLDGVRSSPESLFQHFTSMTEIYYLTLNELHKRPGYLD